MTAFQRTRTLAQLKGLSPKPYTVPVYRNNRWDQLKTTELLPGDLVSLASVTKVNNKDSKTASKSGTIKSPPNII